MSIVEEISTAIAVALPGAQITVTPAGGGHFSLNVRSETFRGKSMVDSHRLVMAAIASLMAGDGAPVHAIDRLRTETP
ncbi:MAG: BolA/IbaG family iron-sulfur metabolism protein [Deltaproteobacteria bacterium]